MNHGFPAWEFSDEHFGLSPVVLLANLMAAVRLRANWPTWWRKQTSRKLPVRDNLLIFLAPQRKVLKWSLPSGVEMMWKRTCPSEDPDKTHTVLCKPTDTAYPMKKLSAICDKKTLCVVNASEAFLEKTMCPKVVPESSVRLSCYERHGSQMRLLLVCLVGRILFCLDLSNHKMKLKST